ncbi:hypothetical protein ACT4US_36695, partial [Bacillus sp. HC-Mk]
GNTHKIALELGDILYYISIMSHEMGYTLEDIAQMNITKCAKGSNGGFKVNICCVRRTYSGDTRDKV